MNKITIYEGNSVNIDVLSNVDPVTGYTGTFYVKKYKSDTTNVMEISGTTSGMTISFRLEEEDTTVDPGRYIYEVRIVDSTDTYTINSGEFIIKDSLAIDDA